MPDVGWAKATYGTAAVLLSLLVAAPSAARAADADPASGSAPSSQPRIVTVTGWYTPDPSSSITLYRPAGDGTSPAVLFVHGGAWGRSQPNSYELSWARELPEPEG